MIKVLLVEDDPMVAKLNALYVNRVEGFETVACAADGPRALALLDSLEVDLILLDVYMPGPSGVDLLASIRGIDLDVDVILVTAARDTRTIQRALKLGAVDYLIKPFEFERMKEALEHYRETHQRMKSEESASQEDLDRLFRRRGSASGEHPLLQAPEPDPLPKGLDRHRLETLWNAIQDWGDPALDFTSEDLAKRVGITRVSVRKYLDFLCRVQVLRMEPAIGAIGRPAHRYRIQPARAPEIRRFF